MRRCLEVLALILVFVAMQGVRDSAGPRFVDPQVSAVTCHFDKTGGRFEVSGSRREPQYLVTFASLEGTASLEPHEQLWPESFLLKISGERDTILLSA